MEQLVFASLKTLKCSDLQQNAAFIWYFFFQSQECNNMQRLSTGFKFYLNMTQV